MGTAIVTMHSASHCATVALPVHGALRCAALLLAYMYEMPPKTSLLVQGSSACCIMQHLPNHGPPGSCSSSSYLWTHHDTCQTSLYRTSVQNF
jgi:hypothetical protein